MVPWLTTLPAPAPPAKLFFPARKSASPMFRLDATRPLTSTREPAPNMTPFGLIRKTLPFDCSAPRIWLGSCPVMRFSTLLSPLCWMKRVISLAPIEKPCQLMMVLGVFVIENRLPCWLKLACPATTCGADGLACAAPIKQVATTPTNILRCKWLAVRGAAGTRLDGMFFMVFNLSIRQIQTDVQAVAIGVAGGAGVQHVAIIELQIHIGAQHHAQAQAGAGDEAVVQLAGQRVVARYIAGVIKRQRAAVPAGALRAEIRRVRFQVQRGARVVR